ncbi:MAG: DUF167 domain-containing protein [bacterium]|nr:DUF167 domain-containing protein [bacterium]
MRIFVAVKTKARKIQVQKINEGHYLVSVKEIPRENKANLAVLEALADYFQLSKSKIILLSGEKSRQKTFEISF